MEDNIATVPRLNGSPSEARASARERPGWWAWTSPWPPATRRSSPAVSSSAWRGPGVAADPPILLDGRAVLRGGPGRRARTCSRSCWTCRSGCTAPSCRDPRHRRGRPAGQPRGGLRPGRPAGPVRHTRGAAAARRTTSWRTSSAGTAASAPSASDSAQRGPQPVTVLALYDG
ncbi:hypothetical protein QJS66_14735 [Kocuria rhizophila]|nr:hypothetical protein QJS66_14735 [Kocuria rhizophila]